MEGSISAPTAHTTQTTATLIRSFKLWQTFARREVKEPLMLPGTTSPRECRGRLTGFPVATTNLPRHEPLQLLEPNRGSISASSSQLWLKNQRLRVGRLWLIPLLLCGFASRLAQNSHKKGLAAGVPTTVTGQNPAQVLWNPPQFWRRFGDGRGSNKEGDLRRGPMRSHSVFVFQPTRPRCKCAA